MGLVAHVNSARLLYPAGDSCVAKFVDGIAAVNSVAGRSHGPSWRLTAPASRSEPSGSLEAIDAEDPLIALSVSVWKAPDSLRHFGHEDVNGGLLRKRVQGFEPMSGPDYVLWLVRCDVRLSMAKESMADNLADGLPARVHDFKWPDSQRAAS